LGSVSQQSLHHATCPVAIIRQGQSLAAGDHAERIVVGIDTSEAAGQALEWAAEEARLRRAALQVVHAWQLPFVGAAPFVPSSVAVEDFEDAVRRFLGDAVNGLDADGMARPVEGILVSGGAASAILDAAEGAGLVVVGSRGHGGFRGLLVGSVSQHIAHHATCPAVVVPTGWQGAVGDDD
jgi:nucleotide-binding universal stress UspA family protein